MTTHLVDSSRAPGLREPQDLGDLEQVEATSPTHGGRWLVRDSAAAPADTPAADTPEERS